MRARLLLTVGLAATLLGCRNDRAPTLRSRSALGWSASTPLTNGRHRHTATLLTDGRVLIAGGRSQGSQGPALSSVELVNPLTGASQTAAPMSVARTDHAAVLLRDGSVLVISGFNAGGLINSAERFDPATGVWSSAGTLASGRSFHTATLLDDGRVVVTGGWAVSSYYATTEFFDPMTNTWSAGPNMVDPRAISSAVKRENGNVLIIGGSGPGGTLTSVEEFVPALNAFQPFPSLLEPRYETSATLLSDRRILVAGGEQGGGNLATATAEIFDLETHTWRPLPSMSVARALHTATLLPSGGVLIAGGYASGLFGPSNATAELFDPTTNTWATSIALQQPRQMHTATLTASGDVLLVGGLHSGAQTASMEYFDAHVVSLSTAPPPLHHGSSPAIITLRDQRVLVVGGIDGADATPLSALVGADGTWSSTAPMNTARAGHAAALLTTGHVIVVGGSALTSTEVFEPVNGTWSPGPTIAARVGHSATALDDGRVLVVGGNGVGPDAELLSLGGSTAPTAPMQVRRSDHRSTLLGDGSVLVLGGRGQNGPLASGERFDPTSMTWASTSPMSTARVGHTATLLLDGRVLVAGGDLGGTSQIYDSATDSWSAPAVLTSARALHSAVVMRSGRVLIAGGVSGGLPSLTSDVFDPSRNTWLPGPTFAVAPEDLTLLPDGSVFAPSQLGADLVNDGRSRQRRPLVATTGPLQPGRTLQLDGSGFIGAPEGSHGGHQASPANHPIVFIRHLSSGAIRAVLTRAFSASTASVDLPLDLHFGPGELWVVTNGVPSDAIAVSTISPLGGACSTAADCSVGLCIGGLCCDRPCTQPCEACTRARGALVDGTCAAVPRGNVCRAASDACDAAELCDGVSAVCPVDALAPTGTPCPAGACTSTGTCESPAGADGGPTDGGEASDAGLSGDAGMSELVSPRGCGCSTASALGWGLAAWLARRRGRSQLSAVL